MVAPFVLFSPKPRVRLVQLRSLRHIGRPSGFFGNHRSGFIRLPPDSGRFESFSLAMVSSSSSTRGASPGPSSRRGGRPGQASAETDSDVPDGLLAWFERMSLSGRAFSFRVDVNGAVGLAVLDSDEDDVEDGDQPVSVLAGLNGKRSRRIAGLSRLKGA
jgi:hypothetical protein